MTLCKHDIEVYPTATGSYVGCAVCHPSIPKRKTVRINGHDMIFELRGGSWVEAQAGNPYTEEQVRYLAGLVPQEMIQEDFNLLAAAWERTFQGVYTKFQRVHPEWYANTRDRWR